EAAGRGDAPLLDDDRAVVKVRSGKEDRAQELARYDGVDLGAALDVVLEPHFALDRDQRADLPPRHAKGRLDDLIDHALRLALEEDAEEARLAETDERSAKLGLDDDDEDRNRGGAEEAE